MRTTSFFLPLVAALAAALLPCGPLRADPPAAPQTHGPNAPELVQVDTDFARMSATEGTVKAFDTYLADDSLSPGPGPGDPGDKANVLSTQRDADAEGIKLTWYCLRAETAASGDFGYTYGAWEMHNKDGKLMVQGKYVTVWKKVNGKWKAVFDMGNHTELEAK